MARFRQMQPQEMAIYVALGNDRDEGLKTLRWTLLKWKFQPISIIILHIDMTKETVMTYCKFNTKLGFNFQFFHLGLSILVYEEGWFIKSIF